MTVYGCGLRISEATQLKTSDIDRARTQLRVRDGKGAKGRVLPLSERLLQELVNHWRAFCNPLMESGVELPVVQYLLGHSSLKTTALYLHVTARRLAEVHSPLDLIGTSCIGQ